MIFIVLNIRLLAGPGKNLNPSLLFDTIIRLIDMDFEGKALKEYHFLIKIIKSLNKSFTFEKILAISKTLWYYISAFNPL